MIMAYVLEQVGHKVCIVGQNDSTADIVEVIESYFNLTINKDEDPIDIDIGKGFLETSKAVWLPYGSVRMSSLMPNKLIVYMDQ